jgi:hypothetical protein
MRAGRGAEAFRASLPALRASEIRHTVAGRRLLLFTSDGIFAVHAGGEGFSARTCQIERVSPAGAGAAPPLDTGAAVLFTAEDDRALLEMRYSFAEDAHVTVDRSVLARHLTEGASVVRTAWQAWPDGILWALLDDGSLLAFTYLPEHEVFAWSRHGVRLAGQAHAPEDGRRPPSSWTSPRQGPCCATPASGRRGATRPPSACCWRRTAASTRPPTRCCACARAAREPTPASTARAPPSAAREASRPPCSPATSGA